MKVLLVEDNEMNRDMLSRRLRRHGLEVVEAVDGRQALQVALAERPDLILMDLNLPEMDGWEATRWLRAEESTQHIPVIALTAHAMIGDRERALQAGCNDYEPKPVDLARLLQKIEALAGVPAGPVVAHSPAYAGSNILVIDDDPATRDLIARHLTREGFRVHTAEDGEQGLRQTWELRPDGIVLDALLPGMDGWAVLSALKSAPELAPIPVVMVTIVDDQQRGLALGATDYLTKPLNHERLVTILRSYCRTHEATQVLVVEDDPATRDLLRRTLAREGLGVIEAANGREALARMNEQLPALILLDLMMPEMDGFQFVAELRRQPAWHAVPVVVLTAKELTAEDRRRLNSSVERVLRKSAQNRDELLDQIRDLLAARLQEKSGPRGGVS